MALSLGCLFSDTILKSQGVVSVWHVQVLPPVPSVHQQSIRECFPSEPDVASEALTSFPESHFQLIVLKDKTCLPFMVYSAHNALIE